jgi:serine/threonine protein phosphatase 1
MNFFIIGDVHGCYYSFKALLEFWEPSKEKLIQVGDLIDRGNYTPQVVKLCREIQKEHPSSVFLKGNHEFLALQYYNKDKGERWYDKYGKKVLWEYVLSERKFEEDAEWFKSMRTYWGNDHIMVSHAGISVSPFCMDQDHYSGLLWHRLEIRNLDQVQVYGHTPIKGNKPAFDPNTNSYNIDTGAYLGHSLTGIKLDEKGVLLETFNIPTIEKDISQGL